MVAGAKKGTVQLSDKEQLEECRAMQRYLASTYNTHVDACTDSGLRDEFLNILREEHLIGSELFQEMEKRGWAVTPPADSQEVVRIRQRFMPSVPREQQA
jgi:hypothetical protein